MFATLTSPSSTWADSAVVEPGLHTGLTAPVLCCPAAVAAVVGAVATKVAVDGAAAAAGASTGDSSNNCTVDGCVGCVADSYACGGYVAPGRLVAFGAPLEDDASVEALLSATNRMRVA